MQTGLHISSLIYWSQKHLDPVSFDCHEFTVVHTVEEGGSWVQGGFQFISRVVNCLVELVHLFSKIAMIYYFGLNKAQSETDVCLTVNICLYITE